MEPLALTHRSRKGCLPCRRRHLKCDGQFRDTILDFSTECDASNDYAESRPGCVRCYCKDLTCDYGTRLIWPDESQAKGIRHGRSGAQPSCSSASTTINVLDLALHVGYKHYGTHFLNTSTADIEELECSASMPSIKVLEEKEIIQSSPCPALTPILPHDDILLSFYDRILCGNATVEDNAQGNPFRALVIPMALESKPVLNALQAVSAKVYILHQPVYRRAALSYQTAALSDLAGIIDNLKGVDCLLEACVICLLLCWFEICCDTNERWLSHLTGLLHLIGRCRDAVVVPPFILNYFLYHFVIARTVRNLESVEKAMKRYILRPKGKARSTGTDEASGEGVRSGRPSLSPDPRSFLASADVSGMTKTLSQWMGTCDLHEINTYPGLSSGLLLLMNQIADLGYLSKSSQIVEHNRQALGIKTMLESLTQYPPTDVHPTTNLQLRASAEIYRLACLLYLHQRDTSIRARIAVRTTSSMVLFAEPCISEMVLRIVAQLEDKLSLARTMANPLWPLFIAACNTYDDHLRVRILALFSKVENDQRYWNVPQVRMLIEKVWRHRDLCADASKLPVRRTNRTPKGKQAAEFDGNVYCDWDRVLQLMANFTWSLT